MTSSWGLLNPNHYLAVAINYLYANRSGWNKDAAVGKTLVSSSMIDRVAADLGRDLQEVPVGFKWFVDGLLNGSCGFGGEESAGASFLRQDGTVWTTDKDGIILDLLAAEITAVSGRDPGEHYHDLEGQFGSPVYQRSDAPANRAQKEVMKNLSPDQVAAKGQFRWKLAGRGRLRWMVRLDHSVDIRCQGLMIHRGIFVKHVRNQGRHVEQTVLPGRRFDNRNGIHVVAFVAVIFLAAESGFVHTAIERARFEIHRGLSQDAG